MQVWTEGCLSDSVVSFDDLFDAIFKIAQGVRRIFSVGGKVPEVFRLFKLYFGDPSYLGVELDADKAYSPEMLLTELVNAHDAI